MARSSRAIALNERSRAEVFEARPRTRQRLSAALRTSRGVLNKKQTVQIKVVRLYLGFFLGDIETVAKGGNQHQRAEKWLN